MARSIEHGNPIKKIIIKGVQAPSIDSDFFDRVADEIEAEYGCSVSIEIKKPRVTLAHKRQLTRLRVKRYRQRQKRLKLSKR